MTTTYYVGADRVRADTMQDALRIAVGLIPERRLGDCVSIYTGRRGHSQVKARVKVLYEKSSGELRYVFFGERNKYGHTICVDFTTDPRSKWFNGAF